MSLRKSTETETRETDDNKYTSERKKKPDTWSQKNTTRLSMLKLTAGSFSKTERCDVAFSSQ